MTRLVKKTILGVDVTNASRQEILEYVFDFLKSSKEKLYIVTPNPEMVVYCRRHVNVRNVLNGAGVALCDGAGLFWAAKTLGTSLKERIPGTDFMENLCKESAGKGVSVGFLGGRNRVAERTAECLMEKYPGLNVVFVANEWTERGFIQAAGLPRIIADSHGSKNQRKSATNPRESIGILFVAYGFPKQEFWIAENLPKLPVRVMMGVGGAFDYISGEVGRAPKPVRSLSLEWLYRLIRQPSRFGRQLRLPVFVFLVLKEKLGKLSH